MSSSAPRRMSAWPRALPPPNSIRRIRMKEALERNIVVETVVVGCRLLGGRLRLRLLWSRCLLWFTLRARLRLARSIVGAATTTAEQLHGTAHVDHDFRGIALDAV